MSHSRVPKWLQTQYPKPKVDPEWVQACVEFLQAELGLNPTTQSAELNEHTRLQLLQSDLSDSMLRNTGLPSSIHNMKKGVIGTPASGGPILVQITAITEIGASAFTLKNVRQARLDKADMTGLTKDKNPEDEGENDQKPQLDEEEDATMPPYPRSMLSIMISDGTYTIKAIEMKRLDELVLGETQLGCKMLLSNVRIRSGIAMLEPANVEVIGYQNDDLHARFDAQFLKSLQIRLGVNDDREVVAQEDDYPDGEQANPAPGIPSTGDSNSHLSRHFGSAHPPPDRVTNVRLSPPLGGRRAPLPATSDSSRAVVVDDSFDDFDVDDEFWQQLDDVEEKFLETRQPITPREQNKPSTSGPRVDNSASTMRNVDIIELDDSEEEKENVWVPQTETRQPKLDEVDTIDLSD